MQHLLPGGRRAVLPALNGLRFIAAAHVMLEHTVHAQALPAPLLAAVGAGYTSATLLLVLSGFILVYVYSGGEGRMTVPRREFWAARFSRIYPLFVLSQLLVLPLWMRTHDWGETWFPLAVGVSGMQSWFPSLAHVLNTPAWTISLLVLAYAAFPWLLERLRTFPARRLPAAMAVTWALSSVPGLLFTHPGPAAARFLFSFPLMRFPEFLFGMLLGRWFLSRPAPGRRSAGAMVGGALAAWAAVLAVAGLVPRSVVHNGLLAPVFALLLVGLASGGGGVVARFLAHPLPQRLGNAGIAIFLLHLPFIAWIESAGWYPGPTTAASALVYAGYLAATLTLSVIVTERFVAPVSRWARRRFGRPRTAPALGAALPVAAAGTAAS
ncbi:MAG TPA: acyltransferase [Longimicrobium sp.]|nr:acyltransferase [Longimicrobium sp.]